MLPSNVVLTSDGASFGQDLNPRPLDRSANDVTNALVGRQPNVTRQNGCWTEKRRAIQKKSFIRGPEKNSRRRKKKKSPEK